MQRIFGFLLVLRLSGLIGVGAVSAQEAVEVNADTLSYEEDGETVAAQGNVVVTKGQTTLSADTVSVSRTRNELQARGNVVLQGPQGDIQAEALRLELTDETGEIENGIIRLPQRQYTITGRKLQKSYGQTYHIEEGSVTTCECDGPERADWRLDVSEFDMTLGGTGKIRGGLLRARDIPLLYVPYGVVPVRKARQSGALAPRSSFSSKRGFQWEQPFYWAISKSQDLTLTADIETSARVGLLGEYRYAPSERIEGEFSASYFNEQIRGPASTTSPVDRWSVTGAHRQRLADTLEVYSDLFFVSDDFFLRELNISFHPGLEDHQLRSRRFTASRVGGLKTWKNAQLRSEARYYQDLRNDQNDVFQVLPQVSFQGQHRFWNDRLEAGVTIQASHFFRNRGYHGQRFDLAPWVSIPFSLGGYVYGSVTATGRETVYHTSSRARGRPVVPGAGRLKNMRTRETVQLQAEFGTRLSRVFDVGWGRVSKLQHVIEPQVSFSYVPRVGQDDLPLYDALDRMNRRSLFVYGVANRLLGKFDPLPGAANRQARVRELLRLSVTQAYDPSRRLREEGERFGLSETDQHFSDVDISAHIRPFSLFTLAAETTYDVDQGDMIAARIGGYLRDPRPLPETSPLLRHLQRRTSLGVSYRTIADRLLKELNSRVVLRLNEYLTLAYFTRYDLNDQAFIGSRYFFRVFSPQKCWTFDFGIVEKVNPDETEFRFSLSLVGITSAGKSAF